MKVFGIAGFSGSGKTTLIEKLIPEFRARGFTVSVIKHTHHRFDLDRPGKDSWRHREAGAEEVLVLSSDRWVLMHELRGTPEPTLDEQLAFMSEVDLVIIEGFKAAPVPKVEVHRRLKVAIFFTGDELVMPGEPLHKGAIYNSNRFVLNALLTRMGCEVTDLGIVRDMRVEPFLVRTKRRTNNTLHALGSGWLNRQLTVSRFQSFDHRLNLAASRSGRVISKPFGQPVGVGNGCFPKAESNPNLGAKASGSAPNKESLPVHGNRHVELSAQCSNPIQIDFGLMLWKQGNP